MWWLLGGSSSRKFRNTRHVASRTSDICAKDMLEVSATNQKLERQSMEIGEGTEVGWSKMGRRGTAWQFVPHRTTVGNGTRTVGESVPQWVFPESSFFDHRFVTIFGVAMKNKNEGILDMQRMRVVNRRVEPRW